MDENEMSTIEWRFNSITENSLFSELIKIFLNQGYVVKYIGVESDGIYVVKFCKTNST